MTAHFELLLAPSSPILTLCFPLLSRRGADGCCRQGDMDAALPYLWNAATLEIPERSLFQWHYLYYCLVSRASRVR